MCLLYTIPFNKNKLHIHCCCLFTLAFSQYHGSRQLYINYMESCFATRNCLSNTIKLSTSANKNGPLSVHSNGVSLPRYCRANQEWQWRVFCLQLLSKTLTCTHPLSQRELMDHLCINPILWMGLIHKWSIDYKSLKTLSTKHHLTVTFGWQDSSMLAEADLCWSFFKRNMTKHVLSSKDVFSHRNLNVYTKYRICLLKYKKNCFEGNRVLGPV